MRFFLYFLSHHLFFEIIENYMKIRINWCDFIYYFAPLWYACVKNFFSFSLCGSQEVPETPKNFVMVSHSSRQANLSWGLPYDGQSPLLAFHLEFQRPVGKFLMSYAPSRGCTITFFLSLTNSINSFFEFKFVCISFEKSRNLFNELKNYYYLLLWFLF